MSDRLGRRGLLFKPWRAAVGGLGLEGRLRSGHASYRSVSSGSRSGSFGRGRASQLPRCSLLGKQVAEDEAVSLDGLAAAAADRSVEDRATVNERVELAVLTARVDTRREVGEQLRVEGATGERAIELLRVNADEDRSEAVPDKAASKLCCVGAPERESGCPACLGKALFPVSSDLREEQIAEANVRAPSSGGRASAADIRSS